MSVPSAPSQAPKYRFSEVDSLRTVACALVIISHTSSYAGLRPLGYLGVVLFFAISGFVVPSSLKGLRWQGVKNFAIRRFWRLYPPLWITLLLIYIGEVGHKKPSEWLWALTMIPQYFGSILIHPQFWTLEIEFVFYVIVAGLFLLTRKLTWPVLLPVYLFCIIFTKFSFDLTFGLRGHFLIVMFWGALCREVLRFDFSRWTCFSPIKGISWARATILGILTGLYFSRHLSLLALNLWEGDNQRAIANLLTPFSGLGFLFWVVLTPVKIGWLAHLGRCTYSTYLLHWGVMVVCVRAVTFFSIQGNKLLPLFLPMVVIILSFSAGALAYRWIEQPSDRIGKRITAS